jgi:hypothetical protein
MICSMALLAVVLWSGGVARPATAAVSLRVNRVIQVPAVGIAVEQNCLGLQEALAPLTDGSSFQPYVVLLEPGTYFCDTTVFVPDWVTLQGIGGRLKALIIGSVEHSLLGLVHLSSGHLRGVTVHNLAASVDQGAMAVSVWRFGGSASATLREVHLIGGAGVNAHAIGAISAQVSAYHAILEGVAHGNNSNLDFYYSVLDSGVVSGSEACIFTRDELGTRLDEDCLP